MISYIDDNVCKLLQALEGTGLIDDTVVIFLSDHGEMLGLQCIASGQIHTLGFSAVSGCRPEIYAQPPGPECFGTLGSISVPRIMI
jgi:arylsulfatase A-like enzyme